MSISVREGRAIIQKKLARVSEGESISHLNIVPLLDIMTILVVFLIKSATMSTEGEMQTGDVALPMSSTEMEISEPEVTVIVAQSSIMVDGKPIVAVTNGDIDAANRTQGQFGIKIGKLEENLSKHHKRLKTIYASRGEEAPRIITLIADGNTPFRLLYSVIYTAGQAEFTKYRMIVMKPGE